MTITDILLLTLVAILTRLVISTRRGAQVRGWIFLVLSVLAIFWMQPAMPIRYLDFWLPVFTLAIAIVSWLLTAEAAQKRARQTLLTAAVIFGLILP